jgi:hypothetical protein
MSADSDTSAGPPPRKKVRILDSDESKPIRQDLFPLSSAAQAFTPDETPGAILFEYGIADTRDLDGFPGIQMVLLPAGLSIDRWSVMDAMDEMFMLKAGSEQADEYFTLVTNQAAAWTAIHYRVRRPRWADLCLAVRKRLMERTRWWASEIFTTWSWSKPEGDTSGMVPLEEMETLAALEQVDLKRYKYCSGFRRPACWGLTLQ